MKIKLLKHLLFIGLISSCTSSKYKEDLLGYRIQNKQHLLQDERFPLKTDKDFEGISYFGPSLDYKCKCIFQKSENVKAFELPTYSGITRTYIEYGKIDCKVRTERIKLLVYKNLSNIQNPIYKNHLFLPFKDITNGQESYGGGRYIDLKTEDIINGKVTIDFNKSYNPWCAYSEGFNCPIPPKENHLTIAIEAGEKNYKGDKKHQ